jgi:hypothetical protein
VGWCVYLFICMHFYPVYMNPVRAGIEKQKRRQVSQTHTANNEGRKWIGIMKFVRIIVEIHENRTTCLLRGSCTSVAYQLPSLPHLGTHCNQTIEKLLSQYYSGELFLISIFVRNQNAIGNLSTCGPAYNKLRLPSKASNFLELL